MFRWMPFSNNKTPYKKKIQSKMLNATSVLKFYLVKKPNSFFQQKVNSAL